MCACSTLHEQAGFYPQDTTDLSSSLTRTGTYKLVCILCRRHLKRAVIDKIKHLKLLIIWQPSTKQLEDRNRHIVGSKWTQRIGPSIGYHNMCMGLSRKNLKCALSSASQISPQVFSLHNFLSISQLTCDHTLLFCAYDCNYLCC